MLLTKVVTQNFSSEIVNFTIGNICLLGSTRCYPVLRRGGVTLSLFQIGQNSHWACGYFLVLKMSPLVTFSPNLSVYEGCDHFDNDLHQKLTQNLPFESDTFVSKSHKTNFVYDLIKLHTWFQQESEFSLFSSIRQLNDTV